MLGGEWNLNPGSTACWRREALGEGFSPAASSPGEGSGTVRVEPGSPCLHRQGAGWVLGSALPPPPPQSAHGPQAKCPEEPPRVGADTGHREPAVEAELENTADGSSWQDP